MCYRADDNTHMLVGRFWEEAFVQFLWEVESLLDKETSGFVISAFKIEDIPWWRTLWGDNIRVVVTSPTRPIITWKRVKKRDNIYVLGRSHNRGPRIWTASISFTTKRASDKSSDDAGKHLRINGEGGLSFSLSAKLGAIERALSKTQA